MVTRAIGEIIVSGRIKYQVCESTDGIGCNKCCKWSETGQCCMIMTDTDWLTFGFCPAKYRSDDKDVYFKIVGEED